MTILDIPGAPAGLQAVKWKDGEPDVRGLPWDELAMDGKILVRRHYLGNDRRFRLHHLLRSDEGDFHDHPWDFCTTLLTGSYREDTPSGSVTYTAPTVRTVRAELAHRLVLLDGPMWTYVETGPVRRMWGYHTNRGWVYWKAYRRTIGPKVTVTDIARDPTAG